MTIGVCYFPEHWPRERWNTDAKQMVEVGIEYVRLAEFSWAILEPQRGEFDFAWLDEAIATLGDYGLKIVLCTPTATPPKWLIDEKPEILQADSNDTARHFGSRRFYCFNSAAYREETERIVRRMAERYADEDCVVGWQTDNEFGCHRTVRCYCDDCAAAFRNWLRRKYDSIDDLNEKWGTTFWSQWYPHFEAIDLPKPTPAKHHPSLLLDYYRFASDSVVDYNRLHADILREVNDDWFVTHNFMGDFETLDAHAVSDDLDLVAWDSYPTGFVQDRRNGKPCIDELRAGDVDQVGMNHDLYRGTSDAPFWVMEQQPGDVNWPPTSPQPGEGAMRLWAHHAIAHGADTVLYFRWRRCRQGQEQYHAGLRKQDGSADRGYHDAARVAAELTQETENLGSVDTSVALLHDYDDWWAIDIQPHSPEFDYWEHLRTYYRTLRARGVEVDIVHPNASLSDYAAIIAPTLHLVDDDRAARLINYVEAGGELLLGARTGYKDSYNKLPDVLQPGPLIGLVGATVDQHESFPVSVDLATEYGDAGDTETFANRIWTEWLAPKEATVVAEHVVEGITDRKPAVVQNEVGNGNTTYVGLWPEPDLADAIVTDVLDRAGVTYVDRLPDGVRFAERGDHVWVTNFTNDTYTIDAPDDTSWIIGDSALGVFDVTVLTANPTDINLVPAN